MVNRAMIIFGIVTAILVGASGCGGGPTPAPKYPVEGKVTFNNKPLEQGIIYFKTLADGTVESMEIVNGAFKGEAAAGERRIEINAYKTTLVPGEMKSEVQENMIPRNYNIDSELKVPVSETSPNQFKFDLKSR